MDIGRIGVWSMAFEQLPARRAIAGVADIEALGYGCLWFPEARGKEAFSQAAILLSGGARMAVATGIANVWARDAFTTAAAAATLAEAFPNRFVVGLGISFPALVNGLRGHRFDNPLTYLSAYLHAMDRAPYSGPAPAEQAPRIVAALGPRMLRLAAEQAAGAHPYFVPVEHTARARSILGPGKILAVEQAVLFETEPSTARALARSHTSHYLALEHHQRNLRSLGWTDNDFADGGSNALVDALVAWGDERPILDRLMAHINAGADHVCIQVIGITPADIGLAELHRLAMALGLPGAKPR